MGGPNVTARRADCDDATPTEKLKAGDEIICPEQCRCDVTGCGCLR